MKMSKIFFKPTRKHLAPPLSLFKCNDSRRYPLYLFHGLLLAKKNFVTGNWTL